MQGNVDMIKMVLPGLEHATCIRSSALTSRPGKESVIEPSHCFQGQGISGHGMLDKVCRLQRVMVYYKILTEKCSTIDYYIEEFCLQICTILESALANHTVYFVYSV